MKIAVLNGSPKGEASFTIHSVKYIEKKFPANEFTYLKIGQEINKLENDRDLFDSVIQNMKEADCLLWSYPVYFYNVPAQIMRFFELLLERGECHSFIDKYATSVSTSANFHDNMAHNYMQGVCEDMSMRYMEGTSWEMSDLLKEDKRKDLLAFASHFFSAVEQKIYMEKRFVPLYENDVEYIPYGIVEKEKNGNKKVILITDADREDVNLKHMIDVFVKFTSFKTEILNIREMNFKGYCVGCGHCMKEGTCIHKDDYEKMLKEKIEPADILIMAGTIKTRYLSSRWKNFWDRMFVNGHRPVYAGKYTGAIISGPLRGLHDLRNVMDAKGQTGRMPFIGAVTDEYIDCNTITEQIKSFVWKMEEMVLAGWKRPHTFPGVGGHKIFRDMIYEKQNLPVFKLDHEYYKKHNLYDFPKPKPFEMLGMMFSGMKHKNPGDIILAPYREVLESEK